MPKEPDPRVEQLKDRLVEVVDPDDVDLIERKLKILRDDG